MFSELLQDHFFWKSLAVLFLVLWSISSFVMCGVKTYRLLMCLIFVSVSVAASLQYGIVGFATNLAVWAALPVAVIVCDYVLSFSLFLKLRKECNCELSPFSLFVGKENIVRTSRLIFGGGH